MTAVRLIVISDLHLGGATDRTQMMSRPDRLAEFINGLPSLLGTDEKMELVIAGDFVDFLAIPPFESWTTDPSAARGKLECTMRPPSPFAPIFAALGALIAVGYRVTIMIGNHDLEMVLPPVQEALLLQLGATPHDVLFVSDGRAHRVGKVLIEHGNRYDDANRNDWTGLRGIVSALSRFESPRDKLKVSAGSQIVEKVVSSLKADYPFIDLFQPQGELVALLLCAFEPGLVRQIDKIGWILRGQRLQNRNPKGLQPDETRYISAAGDEPDPELAAAFGNVYESLRIPKHEVAVRDFIPIIMTRHGLSKIFERQDRIPAERLQQIRVAIRKLLATDESNRVDGITQQYGEAANRMRSAAGDKVDLVIMGHTHLPRQSGIRERVHYINTGTWADVVRIPSDVLADDADDHLEDFLKGLMENRGRRFLPTYADVRITPEGNIEWARLTRWEG